MSNTLETDVDKLRLMRVKIDELRAALDGAEAYRDGLIRQLRRDGQSAIALASVAGLNRSRIYQIIESHPDMDGSDYADLAERIQVAAEYAVDRWHEAGDDSTTPDDFFPLESLLGRP